MADRPGLTARLAQATPIPLDAEIACGPGEVLALVGPSGSGKSTALRCIAGLHRPASGFVAVGGELWLDTARGIARPAHERRVGFVFQSYALFPHMTALANVAAALGHRPAAERATRARELLALVHLAGLEERRPAELSGGQQQRVAVARALARDPAALLLDEPFSAVDRATRERLYRELAELRTTLAMPVVLVTHDLAEAMQLADRLVILHRGQTLQAGAPADVVARPASPQVARLVNHKNIFAGRILEHRPDGGPTVLAWGPHRLEARPQPAFPPGSEVSWVVPASGIVLHRRDRPSRGDRENPLPGTVTDLVVLGDQAHAALSVDGLAGDRLFFSVPTHVAQRNGLVVGVRATVSPLGAAIHLMAPGE